MSAKGVDPQTARRWLVNVVLVLLCGLLAFMIHFVWRLTTVVQRVDHLLATVSEDLRQVAGTSAEISRDISAIRSEMAELKARADASVPIRELRSALDAALEMGASLKAESSPLDAEAEGEIEGLLRSLLFSRMKYDYRGKQRAIALLYGKLYGKYKLMRNALSSADDFIEKVASKGLLGKAYYIVDADGNRHALRDWMLDKLEEHRASGGDSP